jgi:hypothetical protein
MTEQQPLVTWRRAPAEPGRLVADLTNECFASIERRHDGTYAALIGCDGQRPFVLTDLFADRDVAQAWVEDKAQLLVRGIDIAPSQRPSG